MAAMLRYRPRSILVIAPPIVAPLLVWPFAAALGAPFAIDVHSGAVLDRRWAWSRPLLRWLCRRAACAIVTLESLAIPLRKAGATVVVLPDPVPDLSLPERRRLDRRAPDAPPRAVAICGWGDDEPLEALVAAAAGRSWLLIITGRPRRAITAAPNVTFSGFLADEAFVSTLASADALVALTTREDTLLSGAWEALAVGRPLVLSDTDALRSTFGDGPVYVAGADGQAIADGIQRAIQGGEDAGSRVTELATRFRASTTERLRDVASTLGIRPPVPAPTAAGDVTGTAVAPRQG